MNYQILVIIVWIIFELVSKIYVANEYFSLSLSYDCNLIFLHSIIYLRQCQFKQS